MKILHINTFDKSGGAARAANWLHTGLLHSGMDSAMLVQQASSLNQAIHTKQTRFELLLKDIRWVLDCLPLMLYKKRATTHWSTGWVPNQIINTVKVIDPDIIHLHWVCRGFLSIGEIGKICSLDKPVVWTLHDSWAFTGGCHVPGDCKEYMHKCGRCPQLMSQKSRDLSSKTLAKKKKKWTTGNITVVSPSHWLADCARRSALFSAARVEVIPNGIDTALYNPVDKMTARTALHLPESNKKRILCGGINVSGDPNKGFALLKEALAMLTDNGWEDKIEVLVYGESSLPESAVLPVETHFLGALHDDISLRLAYAAADLFVLPSMQENLPNSILESLACNTPVVAFAAGGIPDIFEHAERSFLAKPFAPDDLAESIATALTDGGKPILDDQFTQSRAVNRYQSLYTELLSE